MPKAVGNQGSAWWLEGTTVMADRIDPYHLDLLVERYGPEPQRGEVPPAPLIRPWFGTGPESALVLRQRRWELEALPADDTPDDETNMEAAA